MLINRREFILIKDTSDRHTIFKVSCDDIVAFEAKGNYVVLHAVSETYKSYIGISVIAELFKDDSRFLQLHRSFIISVQHIKYFRGENVSLCGGLSFNVGDMYRQNFARLVATHLIKGTKISP
jgi:LytTr DNA-binding domain